MLPLDWGHVGKALPHKLGETVLVTVHPDQVAQETLSLVDLVVLLDHLHRLAAAPHDYASGGGTPSGSGVRSTFRIIETIE